MSNNKTIKTVTFKLKEQDLIDLRSLQEKLLLDNQSATLRYLIRTSKHNLLDN